MDEQIDTVTRAVMASSVACARCHDHKFDPFLMQDYYALAGVFTSTKAYFGTAVSPSNRIAGDPLILPRGAGQPIFHASIPQERVASLKAQLAALRQEQEVGMAAAMNAFRNGEDTEKVFTLRDALRIFWTSGGVEGQLEKVDESGQALPLAMGVLDRERVGNAPLLERGEIDRPGKPVPRRFPRVIELADAPQVSADHSGRLEFAGWLTHPDHPLTARVITNRVWRHLFGAGLVRTVDNFGFSGERPSHPELLDDLSVRFMADGWSIRKLVREIVLSRTYRQASDYREEAFLADPENRLLWRASKRRLDAEAIRESILKLYGVGAGLPTDRFGRQCLMARRLVEAGVRFVEITAPVGWDHHFILKEELTKSCAATDRPIAALLADLKQRGLLEDTLVVWAGEFGRTPYAQSGNGRDHNNKGYTVWMAGGGVRRGMAYGATDEFGYETVENPMHIHDWHATILHLLGLDHERLTFNYGGRDFRLTDVYGKVATEILG